MMRSLLLAATLWAATHAHAGAVRGKVRIVESPPPPLRDGGTVARVEAPKTNNTNLRDFVVFIEGNAGTNFPPPFTPVLIQVRRDAKTNAIFSPHVLPVLVGTTVEWRNDDSVYHKFFSLSETATFEFPLLKNGDPSPRWTFTKPGRVDVFCSIYANLNGIILVLENPWFTGTDYRNNFYIPNIPAGTYKLKVWHEHLPAQTREITVPAHGELKIDFLLDLANQPTD